MPWQTRSGATASIDPLIAEGQLIVKQLNAIMHNLYKDDAEKMGEWVTASHVERHGGNGQQPPPPALGPVKA